VFSHHVLGIKGGTNELMGKRKGDNYFASGDLGGNE
jgi:hypothetical protein